MVRQTPKGGHTGFAEEAGDDPPVPALKDDPERFRTVVPPADLH